MKTDFETLKALASYTINHLSEEKLIEFRVDRRLDLIDAMATEYGVSFSTDDDIQNQAIEEVEDKLGEGNLPEDITESEMFNHARKEIIKAFNGEAIAGLYMVESLHKVAIRIKNFLLSSDLVDDVFSTDDDLIAFLVQRIRLFSPKRA